MFANWIDPLEPIYLLRRLRREPSLLRKLASKLRFDRLSRVRASWSHTESPLVHWWDIPSVRMRWNRIITGDPAKNHCQYIAENYLAGGTLLHALSLGCGAGMKERQWAETGRFAAIDAYDLSERRIRAAAAAIQDTDHADIVKYRVADAYRLPLPRDHYDVVFFEHSLHHFSPLESLLLRVRAAMKPDGILVANEFVGPSRFQWTQRQLALVNGLLAAFPEEYKTVWNSRLPRLPARRPSKLAMWISDPSEAVESSSILPLLSRHFRILEQKGYGGTLLQLLFAGIAHHFVAPDSEGERLLEFCFALEDLLLQCKYIDHDFSLVVCRK